MTKIMKTFIQLMLVIGLPAIFYACDKEDVNREPDQAYDPIINSENFTDGITNPYYPLSPGKTYIYEGQAEEGSEIDSVFVTYQTKTILGVICRIVNDIVYSDNVLIEQTYDWYAQDNEGNVWYMGEASTQYENGKITGTEGSWEAGVNGAKPGIVMQAHPQLGLPYRQEYLFNEAEDMAKVLSINESTSVPYGSFNNCYMTEEWSELDPGIVENKYYAPGIGNIRTIMVKGGTEDMKLVAIN
jgi:hypothetical protein